MLSSWAILVKISLIYKFHLFKSGMACHCLFICMHFVFPTKDCKFLENKHSLYRLLFSISKSHSAYPVP